MKRTLIIDVLTFRLLVGWIAFLSNGRFILIGPS